MSPRTLHEIYLEPFRRALAGHGVASFMGSYNRLNGEYVCQSRELLNLPRQAWGWPGVSLPDFIFAVRDPRAALQAGLDLPSLGDAAGRTEADLAELGDERLDEIVLHVLTAAAHVGLRRPIAAVPDPPAGSAELARRMVADGMVLLRNQDAILPLAPSTRVAVIDAVGVRNVLVMGGAPSVSLVDERIRSVAECLAEALGAEVVAQSVGHGEQPLPPLDADGGVEVVVRDAVTGAEQQLTLDRFELADPEGVGPDWSAELRTRFRAEQAGPHTVTLRVQRPADAVRRRDARWSPASAKPRRWSPARTTRCTPCSIWRSVRWSSSQWSTTPAWPSASPGCRSARISGSGWPGPGTSWPGRSPWPPTATSPWCWPGGCRARRWTSSRCSCRAGSRR